MNIIYYSMSGNTKSFVERFETEGYGVLSLAEVKEVNDPYVLFTPTYSFGEIPKPVTDFLERNSAQLKAVVSSGNRNWGAFFGKAGELIQAKYGVPLLHKFELRGTQQDFDTVKERLDGGFK